jgi:Cu/Ag efflux protein CusF
MTEPLGHWFFTFAVSAGLIFAPGWEVARLADPEFPFSSICHAQFETAASGVFHGVGIVTEIQAETGALTLDHEDIIGLMPAMVMMYRVKSPEISRGLKVGDRVSFAVDGKTYTILSVKLISPSK